MLPIFKTLLLAPLLLSPLFINQKEAIKVKSLEVVEKNEGIIVIAHYKVLARDSNACFLYLYSLIDNNLEEIKSAFLMEINQDGSITSDLIPYTKLNKMVKFIFYISPAVSSIAKDSQEIMYNAKQNGTKEHTIIERNNGNYVTPGYFIERYDIEESLCYRHYDTIRIFNFEDTKVNNIYNCFDISYLIFKYENGGDNILNGEFYFDIYDSYNIFNNFPSIESSMYKRIPLSLVNEGDVYHFKFARNLYYAPNTHYPSYEYHEGYNETSLLYFPLEYADKLKEIKCRLTFNINGYSSFKLSGEFTLRYIKKYFGDCDESDYCITSNMDDGINVYEKVVEVDI